MRTAGHRKPKPAPVFGAPMIVTFIGIACGLVGGMLWTVDRATGAVLLVVAFSAFALMTYLYRREDS